MNAAIKIIVWFVIGNSKRKKILIIFGQKFEIPAIVSHKSAMN